MLHQQKFCHASLASIRFQACSLTYMSWSFHSDKIQKNFLRPTALSGAHQQRTTLPLSSWFITIHQLSASSNDQTHTHPPSLSFSLPSVTARFQRPSNHLFSFPQRDTTALLMILSCPLPKNASQNPWHHHHHSSPIMQAFSQHNLPQATQTLAYTTQPLWPQAQPSIQMNFSPSPPKGHTATLQGPQPWQDIC